MGIFVKYLVMAGIILAALAAWVFWPAAKPAEPEASAAGRNVSRAERRRAKPRHRQSRVRVADVRLSDTFTAEPREKPKVVLDFDDDESLTATMKSVLKDIRSALDYADLPALIQAVERMKAEGIALAAAKGGGGHWTMFVPKRVQEAAVESLGWFAGDALPELMDFIGSEDPDVAQLALDQFELALQDFSLGDKGRAEIIKMVAQVLTDVDALDWVLSSATDARHSVGIDTLTFIAQHGTEQAKNMVPQYIELFTGDLDISTVSDAKAWLDENPDLPDDEEFYGPIKN